MILWNRHRSYRPEKYLETFTDSAKNQLLYSRRPLYQYNEDNFDLKFNLYQALKQHGNTKTWKHREAVNIKIFSLLVNLLFLKKAC